MLYLYLLEKPKVIWSYMTTSNEDKEIGIIYRKFITDDNRYHSNK